MPLFLILKYIHIVLAIVAVGFNASYGIWLSRAAKEPEHMLHVLRGVRTLDNRFANPAYALLLVSGLSMVFAGGIPLTTLWVDIALLLYGLAVVMGIVLFAPVVRRQVALLETQGGDSPEFRQLARRSTLLGMLTMLDVLLILWLMVFKPAL
jgi:uncharacterized membrane protein